MILLDFLFFRKVVNLKKITYLCARMFLVTSAYQIYVFPRSKIWSSCSILALKPFLPKKRLLLNLFSTYLLKSPPQGSVFGDYFNLTSNIHIHTHNDNLFAFFRNNSTSIAFFLKKQFHIFIFCNSGQCNVGNIFNIFTQWAT